MKVSGTLFTLLTLAKIEVTPGVVAVACTWFSDTPFNMLLRPLAVLLSLTT